MLKKLVKRCDWYAHQEVLEAEFRKTKQMFGIEKSEPFSNLLGILQDYNFIKIESQSSTNRFVRSNFQKNELKNYLEVVEAFKNVLEEDF